MWGGGDGGNLVRSGQRSSEGSVGRGRGGGEEGK